jgi:superoxide reductase
MSETCSVDNKIYDVLKCEKCGNIVEILHGGFGELFCCKAPMVKQVENTVDAATEKHIPIVTRLSNGYEVKVGNIEHPMEDGHYIEWMELFIDGRTITKFLKPGDKPEWNYLCCQGKDIYARAYCNLHGHWKSK